MARTDRLHTLLQVLRDGQVHRASDLARTCGVTVRTIYRDMDTLSASGVPVRGTPGAGYSITDEISLPPLTLSPDELEALSLGLAIVGEATDDTLKAAARDLAARLDSLLPARGIAPAEAWKFATYPFADPVRGAAHLPTLRAAIKARQKLHLTYHSSGDRITTRVVRPLHLEFWGRTWTLTAWCEWRRAFRGFRVDLIHSAEALPEMFTEEPGKRLRDHNPNLCA